MKEYDFVVVGSGVGLSVLSEAINANYSCALIEMAKMGGTCLTRGCIPSKVLVYPADMIREANRANKVGLKFKLEKFDWDLIAKRMWGQIDESKEIEQSLGKVPNLSIYKGQGEFVEPYQMRVKLTNGEFSETFKGKHFILASGGRSLIIPIKGIETIDYVTSESFFGDKFPKSPWKSLTILGGGIIAAEFAHIFSALGTQVSIVEMLPRLVSTEEPEISRLLENQFRQNMQVYVEYRAVAARMEGKKKIITIEHIKTGETKDISSEEVLMATGRRSNADYLKVEKAGIETDSKGWIRVNEFLETNQPNIWAIGDATGVFQFRHKANYDAEIIARNIFGSPENKLPVDYSAVPWAIYTYPRIAHVGMTEKEAIDKGHQIYVAVKRYSSTAKGFAMGLDERDEDGLFKLIVDKSYQILGAHAIGPEADLLVQQFVYLMNAGFTCVESSVNINNSIPKITNACPEAGSFMPIYKSMVIHPSLNEVAGWAIGNLRPVNIPRTHDHHHS